MSKTGEKILPIGRNKSLWWVSKLSRPFDRNSSIDCYLGRLDFNWTKTFYSALYMNEWMRSEGGSCHLILLQFCKRKEKTNLPKSKTKKMKLKKLKQNLSWIQLLCRAGETKTFISYLSNESNESRQIQTKVVFGRKISDNSE